MNDPTRPKALAMAERIGMVLRGAMAERQLSARQVADALGDSSQTSVSSWLTAKRLLPLWRIPELEDVLGVRRGYLLRRAGLVDPYDESTVSIYTAGDPRVILNGEQIPLAPLLITPREPTVLRPVSDPTTSPEGGAA